MLQRVSNDLDEPISIFLHQNQLYYHVGGHHDRALEQFSIVTRSDGSSSAGIERTQAFIFDPDQVSENVKRTKRASDNKGWFVVQLEREIISEEVEEDTQLFGMRKLSWTKITRKEWRASEREEWTHTLNVLRGDHDEKLIVTPAHKQVIEDLGVEMKSIDGKDTLVLRNSESSDRPTRKRKEMVNDLNIEWGKSDKENIFEISLGTTTAPQDVTVFTDDCFDCKEPVRRMYRSTIDGEQLGMVERMACDCRKKDVPCHQVQQNSTADPCTAVRTEVEEHQSKPL